MATLFSDKAMEKAAARNTGEDKAVITATKDRTQPVRLKRQAKAAQSKADPESTHQTAAGVSLAEDIPGQMPASPAERPASRGPSQKPTPVSSPSGQKRATSSSPSGQKRATASADVKATAPVEIPPPQRPEPQRSSLTPEHIGKVKRSPDDQQQRYQQHLAYLKGLGSNTYRMAVDEAEPGVEGSGQSPNTSERGRIEAELAAMLQGLKDDLREKVPLLPEVEAMEQTATTSAESQQMEDSQSDTSGAGYWPRGLPTASTVEDLSQAMDEEVWNKLRQQLRSLQDNIDQITTKFAPKTGTLSASEGTLGYPSKTPQSARSHREMDTRIFLPPQHVPQMGPTGPTSPVGPMGHIHPGRFQRVSHTQLPVPQTPQTPQSTSSNSSMRPQGPQGPPAWHLQSHLPEHIPSSATSESSATVSKAGSCRRASFTSSGTGELQPVGLPGSEVEQLCSPPSRSALCPVIPGCPTRSTTSLNSVSQFTPRSAKITMRTVPIEVAGGAPVPVTLPSRAQSPGRPFVIVRPTTPQVMTPRLVGPRRIVQTMAAPPGSG